MFVNRSGQNEHSIEDLPTKFRFIWPSGFRGEDLNKSYISFNREDFLEINQSETRIAYGSHLC